MINATSLSFILSALALSLSVALLFIWPLLKAEKRQNTSLLQLNINVFKERLQELEQDYALAKIDQETFDALKTELERQLLSLAQEHQHSAQQSQHKLSKGVIWALFLTVLVLVAIAYRGFAYQPKFWHWWQVQTQTEPLIDDLFANKQIAPERLAQQNLPDFARVLQKKLQSNPNNIDGWYMLGIAYLQGELADSASIAFANANRLDPTRDDIALSYAQTLIFSQQGRLNPKSRELLMQVLNKHPDHEGALLLMGMGAFRSGDYAGALAFLPHLKQVHLARTGESKAKAIEEIDKAIAIAQHGGQDVTVPKTGIQVTVKLSKELQRKLSANDVLFVFAKALNGPPMPLAVVKQVVGRFPIVVELNDQQSMMPELKLSKFASVIVGARISKTGTPQGESGDLEAIAVPLTQQDKNQTVELLINQVRP
ncbi:MAG: c-type cytochrome biogenesis protein CcmI [Moraxellaceae bacterium]|nr:c-type cytochrome biogenesis protein CcmI [Moraxellaceae bacterium]